MDCHCSLIQFVCYCINVSPLICNFHSLATIDDPALNSAQTFPPITYKKQFDEPHESI